MKCHSFVLVLAHILDGLVRDHRGAPTGSRCVLLLATQLCVCPVLFSCQDSWVWAAQHSPVLEASLSSLFPGLIVLRGSCGARNQIEVTCLQGQYCMFSVSLARSLLFSLSLSVSVYLPISL